MLRRTSEPIVAEYDPDFADHDVMSPGVAFRVFAALVASFLTVPFMMIARLALTPWPQEGLDSLERDR